jgi:hypothetical protein
MSRPRVPITFLGAVAWALVSSGCGADPATPQGRAELFLDSYYVVIDLPRALDHTSGVARSKVEQSIHLTEGQDAPEPGSRPKISYQLAEERPEGEALVHFVYVTSILADGDATQQKVMLTVRRQDDGWRVTNFQDVVPPPAAP